MKNILLLSSLSSLVPFRFVMESGFWRKHYGGLFGPEKCQYLEGDGMFLSPCYGWIPSIGVSYLALVTVFSTQTFPVSSRGSSVGRYFGLPLTGHHLGAARHAPVENSGNSPCYRSEDLLSMPNKCVVCELTVFLRAKIRPLGST